MILIRPPRPGITVEGYWLQSLWGLLPGVAQWSAGQQQLAVALAAPFFLALGLAIVCLRSPASNVLLIIAASLVWYSLWDAAQRHFPPAAAESAQPLRSLRLAIDNLAN